MPRHTLREFVQTTGQKDLNQGLFGPESDRLLEIKVDRQVWNKRGTMVACTGDVKFRQDGIDWDIKLMRKMAGLLAGGLSNVKLSDRGNGESIQMHFPGDEFVVIQPKEDIYFQATR